MQAWHDRTRSCLTLRNIPGVFQILWKAATILAAVTSTVISYTSDFWISKYEMIKGTQVRWPRRLWYRAFLSNPTTMKGKSELVADINIEVRMCYVVLQPYSLKKSQGISSNNYDKIRSTNRKYRRSSRWQVEYMVLWDCHTQCSKGGK